PNFAEASLMLSQLNIQTGALKPAIEDLQRLLASQPTSVEAHIGLGTAYLLQQEFAKAAEVFRKLVALAPKDPRGPNLLGMALLAQGRRAEARNEFEASLARMPTYTQALSHLLTLDLADKKPDAALARLQKQIASVPQSGQLQYLLGQIHEARGEVSLAEASYLKAIELEPHLSDTYLRLSRLYVDSAKYDQALARASEILKIDPRNLGAL